MESNQMSTLRRRQNTYTQSGMQYSYILDPQRSNPQTPGAQLRPQFDQMWSPMLWLVLPLTKKCLRGNTRQHAQKC